jgi:hypothetical protein
MRICHFPERQPRARRLRFLPPALSPLLPVGESLVGAEYSSIRM